MPNIKINTDYCEDEILFNNDFDDFIDELREYTEEIFRGDPERSIEKFYCLLSISKFILLKEKMLPKNIEEETLYFDSNKYKDFIDPLYELYDYIKTNGQVINKSKPKVIIDGPVKDKQKLEEALLTINKIRDSLSHGCYEYNPYTETLHINNDHSNEPEPYKLICQIPLDILNNFTNDKKSKRYVMHRVFLNIKESLYIEEFCSMLKYFRNEYTEEYKENLQRDIELFIKDNPNFKYDELDFTNTDLFEKYYTIMSNSKKELVENFILEETLPIRHLPDTLMDILDEQEKKLKESNKIYTSSRLEGELYPFISNDKNKTAQELLISLFNYMMITFSNNPSIDYSYIQTKGLIIKLDEDSKLNIVAYNKECERFNEALEKQFANYEKCPSEEGKARILESIEHFVGDFYGEALDEFAFKNKKILTSIRNGVEHGNFKAINFDILEISDTKDNTNKDETKFVCIASPETLLRLTNDVNDQFVSSGYTLKDLLKELKKTIERPTYDKIVSNLNKLSNISYNHDLNTNIPIKYLATHNNKNKKSSVKVKTK